MSLESWGSEAGPQTVSCRLPACGHLVDLPGPPTSAVACRACGETEPTQQGLIAIGRDYVPSADLTWPGASCTSSRKLPPKLQQLSGTALASVDDLVAAISTPTAHHLTLRDSPLTVQGQPPVGKSFLVWRATTAGCEVHGGTVELPEGGVLLLAGRGAHFHGTTFCGGAVMCAGSHYSGTFQDCTFTATAFYAVHGAAVTLRRCIVTGAHIALTLSGSATHATLSDTVLRECHTSVIVDAGATVRAHGCDLVRTYYAVLVTGRASHAALEGCAARAGVAQYICGTGVAVRLGSANLRDCRLEGFYSAIHGEGGGVEARGVAAEECVHGVAAMNQARVLMRQCNLSLKSPGRDVGYEPSAIGASGVAGSRGRACSFVQVERTDVHQALGNARVIDAEDGGSVSATLCRFIASGRVVAVGLNGGGGRAVLAHCSGRSPEECLSVHTPAGRLRVVGGEYEGGSTACSVLGGAKFSAIDCELRARGRARNAGVVHVDGSQTWLRGCRIRDGTFGVFALTSTVIASGTTVCDVWRLVPYVRTSDEVRDQLPEWSGGVGFMCVKSEMVIKGCRVQRCAVGVDAQGSSESIGCLTLEDVSFEDCATGAIAELPRATAKVAGCTFRGLKGPRQSAAPDLAEVRRAGVRLCQEFGDAGVSVRCLHASVQDCSFEGFSSAVHVYPGGSEVPVLRCVMRLDSFRGFGVNATGKATVEDCEFHGTDGMRNHGVGPKESAAVTVRRCSFNTMAAAVMCNGDASAAVVDSTVSGPCERGFAVHGTAQLAVQDCSVTADHFGVYVAATGCRFSAKRVTLQATYANVQIDSELNKIMGAEPGPSAKVTSVTLVDSKLTGATVGVMAVEGAADVALLRCHISAPNTGIYLSGPVTARVKGGKIFDCGHGVIVGMEEAGQMRPCPICGLVDQQAIHAAAVCGVASRSDRSARATARCTHEGAIAKLRMANCEVVRCGSVGVRVTLNGRFEGDRVTVRDCDTGFEMEYNHVRGSFAGCRAIGCEVGAQGVRRTTAVAGVQPRAVPITEVEVLCGDGG